MASSFSHRLERLRFRWGPRLANWLVRTSTLSARRQLKASNPLKILVDNSVLGHSITHETTWVSTGEKMWGSERIDTGYQARVCVYPSDSESREYRNIQFIPGLISLFKQGYIEFYTSAELEIERWLNPAGRFQGYGYFDYNLFNELEIPSVDGCAPIYIAPSWIEKENPQEQRRQRLLSYANNDPNYASLLNVLGQKNSQDAWHVRTAEVHGLHCFLTMDFSLIDTLKSQRGATRIRELKTRIVTPEDLGRELKLIPIHPHILSYNNANSFVRSDIALPNGRQKWTRPKKGRR